MSVRYPLTAAALIAAAVLPVRALGAEDGPIRPDATMIQYPDVSETEIVFVYANDLWLVPRAGGVARKLASPPGQESFPRFSPDGKTIGFVGNYEGDTDIYTLPTDGAGTAFRVTHHPTNETLWDWTPDGKDMIFFAAGGVESNMLMNRLYTVPPTGGLPTAMPVPYGAGGAVSPDGEWLAYTPHLRDFRNWKRYRGGMATDIWLFNLKTKQSRRATDWEGTDSQPMWHGSKLYYLSDAGPEHRLNIWMFDPASGNHTQVTFFEDYDCKWPAIGPGADGRGEIVMQNGPQIQLLDLKTSKTRPVEITIPGDRPALREHLVDYSKFIRDYAVSATGERAAVEARGDIWTLPSSKGITRNLTRTAGVAERDPIWSPDGRWIAYLSDATGEYEIYITQCDGKGETRQLTTDGHAFRYLKSWSPDSKKIAFTDKTGAFYLLDVESKEQTLVATDPWDGQVNPSWSRDSQWLAFALSDDSNQQGVINLYNVDTATLTPVTSSMFASSDPAFDRKGDFLYFTSSRHFEPTYSDIDTTFIYEDSQVLLAVPLRADVESPWKLTNDEEEWKDEAKDKDKDKDSDSADDAKDSDATDSSDADKAKDKDKDAAKDKFADYDTTHPLWGVWSGTAFGPEALGIPKDGQPYDMTFLITKDGVITGWDITAGDKTTYDVITFSGGALHLEWMQESIAASADITVSGDSMSGTWKIPSMSIEGTLEAKKTDTEPDLGDADSSSKEDESKPVVIDLADFESRAIQLDVDPGQFSGLEVNDKNQLLYTRADPDSPTGFANVMLYEVDEGEGKEKAVISGVIGFTLTSDGKKMLTGNPAAGMAIVSAAPGQSLSKTIKTDQMKMMISPREEWRQLFAEAWRYERDFFFYDGNMHGVDWNYLKERYGAMVEDCATREDVSFVIKELIAELNAGHTYYGGGDLEETTPSRSVGMLGCDFELASTDDGTAYRIKQIFRGAPWDTDAVGPLSALGVDVKEGDYLLEVNGIPVDTSRDPWFAFLGTAGQTTLLTVSEKPVRDDTAREVLIKPIDNDANLRYRSRIEQNRAYVDYKTSGTVGYISVPNTGVNGQNDLFRQFYGQRDKAALIIDERWNGGGQIPTRFIELLNRPRTNYWARRDGKDWPWPPDSHQGPKCMLINGLAGSGGDMFPALFRQAGLGKLIGMRTWGGLIGYSQFHGLIDGGGVTAPDFAFYEKNGTWGIEGHGVDPDIEVIDDPALMIGAPEVVADPQLDAAIELMKAEIERNPYVAPKRPASPDRRGMGIREEDK